jgi:hypothetical protein
MLRLAHSLVVLVEILEEMRRNRTMPKPSRDPPKQGVEIPCGANLKTLVEKPVCFVYRLYELVSCVDDEKRVRGRKY